MRHPATHLREMAWTLRIGSEGQRELTEVHPIPADVTARVFLEHLVQARGATIERDQRTPSGTSMLTTVPLDGQRLFLYQVPVIDGRAEIRAHTSRQVVTVRGSSPGADPLSLPFELVVEACDASIDPVTGQWDADDRERWLSWAGLRRHSEWQSRTEVTQVYTAEISAGPLRRGSLARNAAAQAQPGRTSFDAP